jgi:predicted nucleic acid-binding protein
MSAERCFIDTNVLVYLFDRNAPGKQKIAQQLLENATRDGNTVLSTQVLQEFFVSVTRTAKTGLPVGEARNAMQRFQKLMEIHPVTVDLVFHAIDRMQQSKLSFWDSLIVETARQAGATLLWTEDLSHGQVIDGLRVANPFNREEPSSHD